MAKNKKPDKHDPLIDLEHPAAGPRVIKDIKSHADRAKAARAKADEVARDSATKVSRIVTDATYKVAAATAVEKKGGDWGKVVKSLTDAENSKNQANKAGVLSRRLKKHDGLLKNPGTRVKPLTLKIVAAAKHSKAALASSLANSAKISGERDRALEDKEKAYKIAAAATAGAQVARTNLAGRQGSLNAAVDNNRELAKKHAALQTAHNELMVKHAALEGEIAKLKTPILTKITNKFKRNQTNEESELVESIDYCHEHGIKYDSDEHRQCPECEQEEHDKNPPEEKPYNQWQPKTTNEEVTEITHLIIQRHCEKPQ